MPASTLPAGEVATNTASLMRVNGFTSEDEDSPGLGKCAVIGGGGYVGWSIVLQLLRKDYPVAILDLGLMPEAKKFIANRGEHALPLLKFFRVS